VAEEQGQVETQPDVDAMAATLAAGMLKAEEGGESQAEEEAKPEEAQAEEQVSEGEEEAKAEEGDEESQQPEWDWEKIQSLKRKFTVKDEDGSDVEVELSPQEVEKGIMLERAFRMKTAQLAREKESVNQKIKEAVEPKLKEYDEKLQQAEQVLWHTLAPEMQSTDWNKLAAENPAEWAQKYQAVQNVNAQLAQIQAERQKINQAREEEFKANQRKAAQESVEVLQTEIPGWNNDLYGKILKTGVEYGFKPEEVNAITDHRAIKVLWKAMQYDALQKAKPSVEKRSTAKAPKVMKPGTAEKPDASADQWKTGMAQLRKSGKESDAVALAKLMLARESRQK